MCIYGHKGETMEDEEENHAVSNDGIPMAPRCTSSKVA